MTRDEFLRVPPVVIREVPLPEKGDGATIRVKGLTAKEWSLFEQGVQDKDGLPDPAKQKEKMARLVVHSCVNDDNSRMFTMADLPLVQEQLVGVIDRICDAAWEASGRKKLGNLSTTSDDEPPSD